MRLVVRRASHFLINSMVLESVTLFLSYELIRETSVKYTHQIWHKQHDTNTFDAVNNVIFSAILNLTEIIRAVYCQSHNVCRIVSWRKI